MAQCNCGYRPTSEPDWNRHLQGTAAVDDGTSHYLVSGFSDEDY